MTSAISAFLDAVDGVLNSNTFLVFLEDVHDADDEVRIRRLLGSDALRQALLRADAEREWDLFHTWETDPVRRVPTRAPMFTDARPAIVALEPAVARQRLAAMLTASSVQAPERPSQRLAFYSPYRKQRTEAEAEPLVQGLWSELAERGLTRFHGVATDFLFPHDEDVAGYLDGLGCDSVTAAVGPDQIALLFTNGMP